MQAPYLTGAATQCFRCETTVISTASNLARICSLSTVCYLPAVAAYQQHFCQVHLYAAGVNSNLQGIPQPHPDESPASQPSSTSKQDRDADQMGPTEHTLPADKKAIDHSKAQSPSSEQPTASPLQTKAGTSNHVDSTTALHNNIHSSPSTVSALRQYLHQQRQEVFAKVKSSLFGTDPDGSGQHQADEKKSAKD